MCVCHLFKLLSVEYIYIYTYCVYIYFYITSRTIVDAFIVGCLRNFMITSSIDGRLYCFWYPVKLCSRLHILLDFVQHLCYRLLVILSRLGMLERQTSLMFHAELILGNLILVLWIWSSSFVMASLWRCHIAILFSFGQLSIFAQHVQLRQGDPLVWQPWRSG